MRGPMVKSVARIWKGECPTEGAMTPDRSDSPIESAREATDLAVRLRNLLSDRTDEADLGTRLRAVVEADAARRRQPDASVVGRLFVVPGPEDEAEFVDGDPRAASAPETLPQREEQGMSRLENLNKVLKNLQSSSPGVEASALISEDGLIIASALPQDLDETRVGGMSATLLNLGTRAATELRRGTVREVIVRGEHGCAVMISAGRGAVLLVLATDSTPLGLIFFDMRESLKSIRSIL